jgi:hypothetical protein
MVHHRFKDIFVFVKNRFSVWIEELVERKGFLDWKSCDLCLKFSSFIGLVVFFYKRLF